MTEKSDVPNLPLAELLRRLIAIVRRPDGTEWTGKDIVATARANDVELSESHLSELRRGVKTNPTMRVLVALADVFEVPVAYFFGDPQIVEETEAELELRAAMRDAQVIQVAARAADLSPAQRAAFQRVLTSTLREETEPGRHQGEGNVSRQTGS